MRWNSASAEILRVDLTAMIDVIFLLLIFWMMVARFSTAAESVVEQPVSGQALENVPTEICSLHIPPGSDAVVFEGQRLDPAELALRLAERSPLPHVLVYADAGAEATFVQTVLARLRDAGVRRVGVAVRSENRWASERR